MKLIGTHDSATGEKGHGFMSWLLIPFAKTQSKTIRQQYDAGCRYFDIRIKETKRGWVCAHGLWRTKRLATDILQELNDMPDTVQVELTYEGTVKGKDKFKECIEQFEKQYPHIKWGIRAIKYGNKAKGLNVEYEIVKPSDKSCIGGCRGYLPLDGRSWHTYLPIPWLWDRLYMRPHKFNEHQFTFVDFL